MTPVSITQFQVVNDACSTVANVLTFCNSISPGFSTLAATDQAPCLCYNSTSWVPNWFDGAVETCAQYIQTADPSDTSLYSSLVTLEGFCSSVGTISLGNHTTTSTAVSRPTVTGIPKGGSGIQGNYSPIDYLTRFLSLIDMTPGQIAGTSIGCAAAAGLGIYAYVVGWP